MGTETSSFLSHDKTHFLYIVKKNPPDGAYKSSILVF